ncbi:MAG: hypothetical protein D6718_08070, partial [Acidobacteria bacterium]
MRPSLLPLLSLGLSLLAAAGLPAAGVPAAPEIPKEVRRALDRLIDDKIKQIGEQKNEAGETFQRGYCAKNYRPAEGGGYRVTLYKDVITAPKEMKRERYELILAPGEDGDWRIASEEK